MRRHELRSTMMTSNRPLEDWGKLIGDVPAAAAILDRFLQSAEGMQITGRSFILRGHRADTEKADGQVEQPKTGQSRHRVGPRRAPKKPANNAAQVTQPGRFSPAHPWLVLTCPLTQHLRSSDGGSAGRRSFANVLDDARIRRMRQFCQRWRIGTRDNCKDNDFRL